MAQPSTPPQTAAAAAAGGFGGALLGVIVATAMMGDGDSDNTQSAVEPTDSQTVEMAANRE